MPVCSLLALYGALCLVEMGPRKALGALKPVVTHRCGVEVGFWPAVRVGLAAAMMQPPCIVAGVLDERRAAMGSPLVLGRRGRKSCPC